MTTLSTEMIGRATMNHRLAPLLLAVVFAVAGSGCSGGGPDEDMLEAPSPPSGVEASSQDGKIKLSWNTSSTADAYRVYRSTTSGVDASESPLETGIDSTSYVDGTAENGTMYYYVVTAVASEGGETAESNASDEVGKTPFPAPPHRP